MTPPREERARDERSGTIDRKKREEGGKKEREGVEGKKERKEKNKGRTARRSRALPPPAVIGRDHTSHEDGEERI